MTYSGGKFVPGVYPNNGPGVFTLVRSESQIPKFVNVGGVVAVPLSLNWGKEGDVIRVTSEVFFGESFKLFGLTPDADELKPITEIFSGGAKEVLVYRLNGAGEKAKTATTVNEMPVEIGQIATARYSGEIGNRLSTAVLEQLDNADKFEVQTLLNGSVVDRQYVSIITSGVEKYGNWDDLKDNSWIIWNRIDKGLIPHESTPLVGGVTGNATAIQSAEFRKKILKYEFDTLALGSVSDIEKRVYVAWTRSMDNNYGIKFRLVVHNYGADDWRVINVKTTAKGEDPAGFVYFTAGLDASLKPGEISTNKTYTGGYTMTEEPDVEVLKRSIDAGEFWYHTDDDIVGVYSDRNSFVSITEEENTSFTKPNTIRISDFIQKQDSKIVKKNFLGKVKLDKNGLNSLKGQLLGVREPLVSDGTLKSSSAEDILLTPIGDDGIHILSALDITGMMERFYIENIVR